MLSNLVIITLIFVTSAQEGRSAGAIRIFLFLCYQEVAPLELRVYLIGSIKKVAGTRIFEYGLRVTKSIAPQELVKCYFFGAT